MIYVIHPSSYSMSLFNELYNKVVPTNPKKFAVKLFRQH
jgi:hypothetical protein